MKTTYAQASIALALMSSGSAIAHSHHHRSDPSSTLSLTASLTASVVGTAYPTATAPANSTGGSPITPGTCNDCSGVCVTFGATDDSHTYWFNGGPGGKAASFAASPLGSVCLTDAGAMFVGSSAAIAPNGDWNGGPSTKFEWSVGADRSNFDVSTCDGFSVPMSCTGFAGNMSPFETIGGDVPVCANDCPAEYKQKLSCQNPGAHTGDLQQVPTCFTEGAGAEGESGSTNNYWYYDNISVQSIFTGRTGVVCTVGGTSSNAKRATAPSGAELGPRASKHRHQRRGAHAHGAHAIS